MDSVIPMKAPMYLFTQLGHLHSASLWKHPTVDLQGVADVNHKIGKRARRQLDQFFGLKVPELAAQTTD